MTAVGCAVRRRAAQVVVAVALVVGSVSCADRAESGSQGPEGSSSGPDISDAAPTGSTWTVPLAVDRGEARAVLDRWRARVDAFGASAAIRVPGQPDVVVASGLDGRSPESAMTGDGTFLVGEVSTTFLTALTFLLIAEGALSLDATLDEWVPEHPNADTITIRMLLGHTSGTADFVRDQPDAARALVLTDLSREFTPLDVLELARPLPPQAEPGSGLAYANTNFAALAIVLEDLTGEPLADLIESRLSAPLGLHDTVLDHRGSESLHGWFTLDAEGRPDHGTVDDSVLRDLDTLDFPHQAVLSLTGGSGAMRSSLTDLLTWAEALYNGTVVGPRQTAAMLEFSSAYTSLPTRHGLGVQGWCPCDHSARPPTPALVGYLGEIIGSRSAIAHDLDSGVTIAIHTNVQNISHLEVYQLLRNLQDLTVPPTQDHQVAESDPDPYATGPTVLSGAPGDICRTDREGRMRLVQYFANHWRDLAGILGDECREIDAPASDPECDGEVRPEFSTCWSTHAAGLAIDLVVRRGPVDHTAGLALGDEIVDSLLASGQGSQNLLARRMGIRQILWNSRCWDSQNLADRAAQNTAQMRTCQLGGPHDDHIHLTLSIAGANGHTTWFATDTN